MTNTNNLDITSANATAVLTVEEIYPSGVELQMFGTDQAMDIGQLDITETRKGVDGKLVAGYVPVIHPVTITLEASSPTAKAFGVLWEAMTSNKKVYACNLVCTVPSIGKTYTWSVGVMKAGTPMPSLQKVLAPTTWVFHFQDFEKSDA